MLQFLKNLFKSDDTYTTDDKPKITEEEFYANLSWSIVPDIDVDETGKYTILIVDDEWIAIDVIKSDIDILKNLADTLKVDDRKLVKREKDILSYIETEMNIVVNGKQIPFIDGLKSINFNDFKAVGVSGDDAGVKAIKFINSNKTNIDIAILDIIMGRFYDSIQDHSFYIDGVDVLKTLLKHNPDVHYFFYSGFPIEEDNIEHTKFKALNGCELESNRVFKDSNHTKRRIHILRLMLELTLKEP